jgi:hypothetical protein
MTLITLTIMVVLIVGFLSSMTLERRAAGAFADAERAKLVAQGAVSHAIDILRTNIPEPARLKDGPRTAPGNQLGIQSRSIDDHRGWKATPLRAVAYLVKSLSRGTCGSRETQSRLTSINRCQDRRRQPLLGFQRIPHRHGRRCVCAG